MTTVSPLADGSADPALSSGVAPAEPGPAPTGAHTAPPADVPTTVASGEPGAEDDDKRRYPSTIGGAFYLSILAVSIASIVIVTTGHWRGGIHWLAGALIAGALFRGALPERDAGMLAVRSRWLDTALLLVFGGVLWFLASTLPAAPA